MNQKLDWLRQEYLSGQGFLGPFLFPYSEEIKKSQFFLETMESFVETSEREEVRRLEQGIEALSPEQRDEYWQWHYPFHWEEIFANRLRAAFILQLCSFLEGELAEISQRIELIARAPLKVSDLHGSTISKPRKYLEAFGRLGEPTAQQWQIVERIFDVRNVMVHERGFAGGYRNFKKIIEFSGAVPGLEIRNDHLEVKRAFCDYALSEISQFCRDLHGAYEAFRASAQTLERLQTR